jgi:hypothetical protein
MHNKPAIIMMAAVMLAMISGCGKKDTAWVEPPIVTITADNSVKNNESANTESRLINTRDALNLPSASRKQYGISENAQNESESELTARFMKSFNEWRDYRSQLPDKLTYIKPEVKKTDVPVSENGKPVAPVIEYVPEYAKSTDILNGKIRVMLLENRLKTAGEAEKIQIAEKLKLAQDALIESERVYGQLIPAATPAVAVVPNQDDIINHVSPEKEIIVANMNSDNITDTLAGLGRSGMQQSVIQRATSNQSILNDYHSMLNETITEINKVLVELGKRR